MVLSSLQLKIKNLAEDPGVYLMKDARGSILYVGKAKNLKNRVSSYFQDRPSERRDLNPRIELLCRRINDFEIFITDTEVEALILECNLIKKYRPPFNVALKDDKTYPYVRLDLNHPFPRLEFTRRVRRDGARYFGPYVSSYQVREVLEWARKAFQLRDCSDHEFRNRSRPCLLHQMGQCSAPCVGLISGEDYGRAIDYVLKLLNGGNDQVLKGLHQDMAEAAESEQFERAAALRDRMRAIEAMAESQKIDDPESEAHRDIVHFARHQHAENDLAVVVIMSVRDGRTVGAFQFPVVGVDPLRSDSEFLFEFLAQYYLAALKDRDETVAAVDCPSYLWPSEVLLPESAQESAQEVLDDYKLLKRALSARVSFRVPKRGEARAAVEMVRKTAEHHLEELRRGRDQRDDDLADVQWRLDLKRPPRMIECYDISHFQGEGTVASRVVFVEGKAEKSLYRHYHVNEAQGPDDFKSLFEVLQRRFSGGDALPDLVVIDGGRGQLAQAEEIFEQLGVVGVELVSLAKARTERAFQETEVKSTLERVFKPGQKNPILLKPSTGAYRILTQVRDESHRFAITFHRKVRDRRRVKKQ